MSWVKPRAAKQLLLMRHCCGTALDRILCCAIVSLTPSLWLPRSWRSLRASCPSTSIGRARARKRLGLLALGKASCILLATLVSHARGRLKIAPTLDTLRTCSAREAPLRKRRQLSPQTGSGCSTIDMALLSFQARCSLMPGSSASCKTSLFTSACSTLLPGMLGWKSIVKKTEKSSHAGGLLIKQNTQGCMPCIVTKRSGDGSLCSRFMKIEYSHCANAKCTTTR